MNDRRRGYHEDEFPTDELRVPHGQARRRQPVGEERRAEPGRVGPSRANRRREAGAAGRKRRGRALAVVLGALVLVVVIAGGAYGGMKLFGGEDAPADYAGPGGNAVVIEVRDGDTADQIATEMVDKDVTASGAAFYNAAVQNSAMNSVQPGFYRMKSQMAAADAVTTLVDPESRVGQIVIAEGRQLHDSADVNTGAVKKGIYTLISEASCAVGQGVPCVSYDELNAAGAGSDSSALGVPEWATDAVARVPDRDRQLEGLIAAGTFNFDPSASAADILKQLVSESSAIYENTGLVNAGAQSGLDPYQTLVASSLIEREALPNDFAKVARVILNRLAIGQRLEFDSTVNYALDTTEVATTDGDRAAVTPWNTYAMTGLPATPICSPSVGAVQAAENPEPGNWLYFVTINAAGDTLFTDNYEQHLANIQQVEPGFLASGR
ncbi:aminodeoxychorismate lyase [Rhodococcoides trifolii]|uniref:Endolytic murein transglycosylase n=1 Tax=Rhodococcoides trifolii TaxID=908250 RepID=A0A917D553_9NOCA|nr:endolytic transglycosylase MltG [Rhodococcus trifolii]GGG09114.1 aminodeoxychorismate lyase [Rhodococcus trifolii]